MRRRIIPVFAPVFAALMLLAAAVLPAQQADPLNAAAQKEFVFLDAEARLLQQRIAEVTRETERKAAVLRREIDGLETELLSVNGQAERRNEDLRLAEQADVSSVSFSDVVGSVLDQAAARLERHGVSIPAAADPLRELQALLAETLRVAAGLGTIRREPGRFFLEDGTEVEGSLVHLGAVASLGIAGERGGTLAPAGGGRLRLVKPKDLAAARDLESGRSPRILPLFLYSSLDKLAEDSQKRSFREHVRAGGPIGLVILAIGAASIVLVIGRLLLLWRASRRETELLEQVMESLGRGELGEARTRCADMRGAVGRVLAATLRALHTDPSSVEDVISESVLNEQPAIERFRSTLNVFAAVAPLLGLLGTVTGMITTFDVITRFGTGDPKLLSGGISEALVTTEFGLFVAIPVLLIANLLASWSDRITSDLEVTALRAVNATAAARAGVSRAGAGDGVAV